MAIVTVEGFLGKADGKVKKYKDFYLKAETTLTDRLLIVIPDMHLLEKEPSDDFLDSRRAEETLGSKTAFEERFLSLLDFLYKQKKELREHLEVVQLGDMYDLWQARGGLNRIESRYADISGLLDELQTVYTIGNHDIDLWNAKKAAGQFARKWRHFSTADVKSARVMFEHGFQADFYNNQEQWSGVVGREITRIIGSLEYINPDIDVRLGYIWDEVARAFSAYNAALTPAKNPKGFNSHEYLDYYVNAIARFRKGDTDDHLQTPELLCAVIGHTHQARLVTRPFGDKTFYLMDCGSWVNGGHEFGIITGDELAVCQWG